MSATQHSAFATSNQVSAARSKAPAAQVTTLAEAPDVFDPATQPSPPQHGWSAPRPAPLAVRGSVQRIYRGFSLQRFMNLGSRTIVDAKLASGLLLEAF